MSKTTSNYSFLLLCIIVFFQSAFAATPDPSYICARNFVPNAQNIDPCARNASQFRRLKPAINENLNLCTKIYAESFCESSPNEFRHAQDIEGKPVCTVHYQHEGVAEYCDTNPKMFQWALGVAEEN